MTVILYAAVCTKWVELFFGEKERKKSSITQRS